MGCASSTEVVTDPLTGQTKEKKKFGGAYPGNRRPQNQPYAPPTSNYGKVNGNTSTATAHFVAYGGGNALVLVDQANAQPQLATGGPPKEYISVTLPGGVHAGDTIHVQAPDGRVNAIVVPPGMGAGSTFTVEFAAGPPPTSSPPASTPGPYVPAPFAPATSAPAETYTAASSSSSPAPYVPAAFASSEAYDSVPATTAYPPGSTMPPPATDRPDDGFASGFNR